MYQGTRDYNCVEVEWMESKFDYKIKHHIVVCAYEKLWIILTALMLVSVILMIRGSTAPLLIDNVITRTLFCSDVNGDKTIYNIAISYFAAYIFYILQVYYPERKKTRDALITTSLDVHNLINQTRLFMFVWEEVTNTYVNSLLKEISIMKFEN